MAVRVNRTARIAVMVATLVTVAVSLLPTDLTIVAVVVDVADITLPTLLLMVAVLVAVAVRFLPTDITIRATGASISGSALARALRIFPVLLTIVAVDVTVAVMACGNVAPPAAAEGIHR